MVLTVKTVNEENRMMPPIYKIGPDDEVDELELELEFQASLTVDQRYRMMINASRTILKMLIDNGHKKPFEIIKRT